jgi:hypothetical protein
MKKLNQLGMLSLHVIVPVVIAIAAVGGIGAYVLTKSNAQTPVNGSSTSCGTKKRNGQVYASAVGTNAKFKAARDSDSVRNLAYALCKKGKMTPTTAQAVNKSGNWSQKLQDSLDIYRRDVLRLTGSNSQGSPGKISVTSLGLTPVGF